MKFLMLVCTTGRVDADPVELDPTDWVAETSRRGVRLQGERLDDQVVVVRVRESGRLVTDGPFVETAEHIGGFDIIDCDDVEAAVEIAAAHPMAPFGHLVLRPFFGGGVGE
ncbi:MAG: YciI family protein [Ilumatobacteraceae bacterium]